jgi:hypothetical protein
MEVRVLRPAQWPRVLERRREKWEKREKRENTNSFWDKWKWRGTVLGNVGVKEKSSFWKGKVVDKEWYFGKVGVLKNGLGKVDGRENGFWNGRILIGEKVVQGKEEAIGNRFWEVAIDHAP